MTVFYIMATFAFNELRNDIIPFLSKVFFYKGFLAKVACYGTN